MATAVVYLNDAREFEGGQLQFQDGDLRNVAAAQGSMVCIAVPSFLLPTPCLCADMKVDHLLKLGTIGNCGMSSQMLGIACSVYGCGCCNSADFAVLRWLYCRILRPVLRAE